MIVRLLVASWDPTLNFGSNLFERIGLRCLHRYLRVWKKRDFPDKIRTKEPIRKFRFADYQALKECG